MQGDDFSQLWNWYIILIVDFMMFFDRPVKAVCDIDNEWLIPFIINEGEVQTEGHTFRCLL